MTVYCTFEGSDGDATTTKDSTLDVSVGGGSDDDDDDDVDDDVDDVDDVGNIGDV